MTNSPQGIRLKQSTIDRLLDSHIMLRDQIVSSAAMYNNDVAALRQMILELHDRADKGVHALRQSSENSAVPAVSASSILSSYCDLFGPPSDDRVILCAMQNVLLCSLLLIEMQTPLEIICSNL